MAKRLAVQKPQAKMAKKPTKLTALSLKTRPSEKRREIPDAGAPGLYLIIHPSGAKAWALRFRRPSSQPAKLTLGSVNDAADKEPENDPTIGDHLTLAAARRLAAALRHDIAMGRDPAAAHLREKQRRRAAAVDGAKHTFGSAARDFVEKYASKKIRRWQEISRLLGIEPADLTLIDKGLAQRWANRQIAEINDDDIDALIDETRHNGAPGLKRRASGPTETRARAMMSCLSRMFKWLMTQRVAGQRRATKNPCVGIQRPETPKSRDRVLSNSEIVKFWQATDAEREPFGAILKVLLLTGCRLNEVAGMARSELSEDGTMWLIPGERTKNRRPHTVPLAPTVREIIAGVPGQGPRVFRATSTWYAIKQRLDGAMKIPGWRIHDLRRTAATGMAEINIHPYIVEACLNHVSGVRAGVAGTYNRAAYAAEKKAALERWADHVGGLVAGREAKVVPMRKAGA